MDEEDFEGTIILERMAEINKLDDFWEAVDSDDFQTASRFLKRAKIESETIELVLKKMRDADGGH